MLTKVKGEFLCECDFCGAAMITGCATFEEAQLLIRSEGWNSWKDGADAEWTYMCPDCESKRKQI